jgi:DNA-binding Xre family transcriptional regulator
MLAITSTPCYNYAKHFRIKGGNTMNVSYKKLWKLLIDLDMKKIDLRMKSGISISAMAKLGRSENVTVDTLVKVCHALDCEISDIIEILPKEKRT